MICSVISVQVGGIVSTVLQDKVCAGYTIRQKKKTL